MWPVHARGKASKDDDEHNNNSNSNNDGGVSAATTPPRLLKKILPEDPRSGFFLKDGRKIHKGDCALFQSGNAPPFIGIIRWFSSSKEDYLKLSVNWLYRPSDLKLAKGVPLEAAPNEVFYSFHKDEISAESLLHPCKVAFLRKGVELPSGISSFVCRRVYDITNKRLWWLTDQDYINEHQEEVDHLLDKTQLEMHAAVQSGGRSPKQLNGPSAQQLKSGSDSVQNSGSSVHSHGKGRKREKAEQSFDSTKRDRAHKPEDMDSANFKSDGTIKAEISKITDRGGLVDTEGVEKLLNLMQHDKGEKKIDSASRVLLADVIASTDRFECLVRFVQLKGVLVLDDWLQEAHKGKLSEGSSPRENEKSVDELLLALLRALDKLPVNLHALQTSYIGKSVNNLRQHKNSEVQKKARHLVDTWKKRVDAEMTKSIDTKSSGSGQTMSWSGKSGASDTSHAVGRRTGSSETALKAPSTQTSLGKGLPSKVSHVDSSRPAVGSSGSSKLTSSVAISSKDVQSKPVGASGPSEMQLAAIKEEKSSGSSQSLNNSQSCSSDHARNGSASWREDARSSTAGSIGGCKGSGSASRHRKSSNGYMGTASAGPHKDSSFGKSTSHQSRNVSYDKVSPSGTQSDRLPDAPSVDSGNNQRLVVRLPNPGRSPARGTSVSMEEASVVGSRASSPVSSEKHDHSERKIKVKGDSGRGNPCDVNVDTFPTNYKKSTAAEDTNQSPGSREEDFKNSDDNGIVDNAQKPSTLVNNREHLSVENKSSSSHGTSLVSALIESSAPCPEIPGSLSTGDDLGMNLLASVATGEMPKSDCKSPASPVRSSLTREHCTSAGLEPLHPDRKVSECERHVNNAGVLVSEETKFPAAQTSVDLPQDGKKAEDPKLVAGLEETSVKQDAKSSEGMGDALESCLASPEAEKMALDVDRTNQVSGKRKGIIGMHDGAINSKHRKQSPSLDESRPMDSSNEKVSEATLPTSELVCSSLVETDDSIVDASAKMTEHKQVEDTQLCATANIGVDKIDIKGEDLSHPLTGSLATPTSGTDESSSKGNTSIVPPSSIPESTLNDLDQNRETGSRQSHVPSMVPSKEIEWQASCKTRADSNGELTSSAEAVPSVKPSGSKCVFDLNEGINSDDGNAGDASVGAPFTARPPSFLPSTISPASITVAAPAKGPFVPPENLLKSKGEPGWKGSAATSAFRPAEPRKILEMSLNASDALSDSVALKQSRPLLEFDLNIPDERVLQDIASHNSVAEATSRPAIIVSREVQGRNGGLDLDLNRVEEDAECRAMTASTSQREEAPNLLGKPVSVGFPNADTSSRGFDLNNGPALDEVGLEPASRNQHPKNNSGPFIPSVAGVRMSGNELGNLPWFPPGNSYSAVAIPHFLPDRCDHTYPVVAGPGAPRNLGPAPSGSFNNDLYRGPVLSSSPAMAFSPYANFPFGPSFPLPSTSFSGVSAPYVDSSQGGGACFPPVPSQLTGQGTAASQAYVRPILISIPDSTSSGSGSDHRIWGRQSLDLNAGPIIADVDGRDERLSGAARQHFVASSQPFPDDPARLFQMAGAGLKRKEPPEGGWDSDRFTYKQPSRP